MSQFIVRSKSPEEEELERKLAELDSLEQELIQRELELTTQQGELQAFELLYLHVVGIKIAKLDDINAQIAEVLAKIHANDKVVENEAKRARAQAEETAHAAGSAESLPESREQFKPSENLKSLYREAAKRVHPDLATDENDRRRRTTIMAEVNAALQIGR